MQKINKLINFGIINIDKPSGPTSFTISDYVRKSLNLNKTSHFGTLDPKVTGVLPIALGRGCKLTGFFLGHNKTYIGVMHTHKEHTLEELQKLIDENFVGKIMQLPPKKSRVKRAIREREVVKFELLEESENKKDFLFVTEVQGGTYIRKLCSDLGEMKEVEGAHMAELRRTNAGIFPEDTIVNLFEFDKAVEAWKNGKSKELEKMITPGEEALKKVLPVIEVKKTSVKNLLVGKPLMKKYLLPKEKVPKEEIFAVFSEGKFIEIARKVDESGGIFGRAEFVFN